MKKILDGSNPAASEQYETIITKINKIITKNETRIHHDILYSNPTISDTVDSLSKYASDKSFDMVIMGTRGLTTLQGLISGSLAHNMLSKSTIPVLMIKKLPQEFIDNYCG
ncbi:MAG: universal stress protein [Bacillota bacterium]|nr:universal stress protein [Bacillota bacterium]MDP4160176.1 universal stress protein [Bacillota bacterium]